MGRYLSVVALLITLLSAAPSPHECLGQEVTGTAAIAAAESSLDGVFTNFLHFSRLGRFDAAASYGQALLSHPDLTPIGLLEASDRDTKCIETLTILLGNATIGPSAEKVLALIQQGEYEKRRDRERILANIASLGGSPQAESNALEHLKQSGEYAIPWMLQTLADPAHSNLHPRIARALPKIGKNGLNPMLEAVGHPDPAVQRVIVAALGEAGYRQSIPYLLRVLEDSRSTPEVKGTCQESLGRILGTRLTRLPSTVADSFTGLADAFYREESSVRADSRWDFANVWRWNPEKGYVDRIEVPREIFGPVMAMHCAEEALSARPDHEEALVLWLAANIRREARLGIDVESDDPTKASDKDATRPAAFPRALYFSQTAGAHVVQNVLARALADSDQPVALGAIAALRTVAGPDSLIGADGGTSPLVEAMRFPNMLVRYRAALALAEALPRTGFYGSEAVVPTLAEALNESAVATGVVVVDGQSARLKEQLAALAKGGFAVVGEGDLATAQARARAELKGVGAYVLASDLAMPRLADAVRSLREDPATVHTPILILTVAEDKHAVEELAQTFGQLDSIPASADAAAVASRLDEFLNRMGSVRANAAMARSLALEAARALRGVAADGRTPFDLSRAESALISGMKSGGDDELRLACARALSLVPTGAAQSAIVTTAMDNQGSATLRLGLFNAAAESGRANGRGINDAELSALIQSSMTEPDATLRAAASRALGAMNTTGSQTSEIVRKLRG